MPVRVSGIKSKRSTQVTGFPLKCLAVIKNLLGEKAPVDFIVDYSPLRQNQRQFLKSSKFNGRYIITVKVGNNADYTVFKAFGLAYGSAVWNTLYAGKLRSLTPSINKFAAAKQVDFERAFKEAYGSLPKQTNCMKSQLSIRFTENSKEVGINAISYGQELVKLVEDEVAVLRKAGVKRDIEVIVQTGRTTKRIHGHFNNMTSIDKPAKIVIYLMGKSRGQAKLREFKEVRYTVVHEFGHFHHYATIPSSKGWKPKRMENYADSYCLHRGLSIEDGYGTPYDKNRVHGKLEMVNIHL